MTRKTEIWAIFRYYHKWYSLEKQNEFSDAKNMPDVSWNNVKSSWASLDTPKIMNLAKTLFVFRWSHMMPAGVNHWHHMMPASYEVTRRNNLSIVYCLLCPHLGVLCKVGLLFQRQVCLGRSVRFFWLRHML